MQLFRYLDGGGVLSVTGAAGRVRSDLGVHPEICYLCTLNFSSPRCGANAAILFAAAVSRFVLKQSFSIFILN